MCYSKKNKVKFALQSALPTRVEVNCNMAKKIMENLPEREENVYFAGEVIPC